MATELGLLNPAYTMSPELPGGLTIDPATGTISGTPTAGSPSTSYTVTATGHDGHTVEAIVIITMTAALARTGAEVSPLIALMAGLLPAGSLFVWRAPRQG